MLHRFFYISTMTKVFTAAEVSSHNKPDSLYITIDGDVYDLTKFQDDHPGEQLFFFSHFFCLLPL